MYASVWPFATCSSIRFFLSLSSLLFFLSLHFIVHCGNEKSGHSSSLWEWSMRLSFTLKTRSRSNNSNLGPVFFFVRQRFCCHKMRYWFIPFSIKSTHATFYRDTKWKWQRKNEEKPNQIVLWFRKCFVSSFFGDIFLLLLLVICSRLMYERISFSFYPKWTLPIEFSVFFPVFSVEEITDEKNCRTLKKDLWQNGRNCSLPANYFWLRIIFPLFFAFDFIRPFDEIRKLTDAEKNVCFQSFWYSFLIERFHPLITFERKRGRREKIFKTQLKYFHFNEDFFFVLFSVSYCWRNHKKKSFCLHKLRVIYLIKKRKKRMLKHIETRCQFIWIYSAKCA